MSYEWTKTCNWLERVCPRTRKRFNRQEVVWRAASRMLGPMSKYAEAPTEGLPRRLSEVEYRTLVEMLERPRAAGSYCCNWTIRNLMRKGLIERVPPEACPGGYADPVYYDVVPAILGARRRFRWS